MSSYEELRKEKDKEIERLKSDYFDMKDNFEVAREEIDKLNYMIVKREEKIERLNNIIKEVREEIRILETNCDIADYQAQKLFQILDKV